MFYYRIKSTQEVLGAAMSSSQGADWIARYAAALGEDAADIEQFESASDPRGADARTEPSPTRPTPEPKPGDLLLAIFDLLGKQAARTLARTYPDAMLAIDHTNWPLLRAAVDDMLADGAVTQEQYDGIQSLFSSMAVPE